jgi:hypothetical protein
VDAQVLADELREVEGCLLVVHAGGGGRRGVVPGGGVKGRLVEEGAVGGRVFLGSFVAFARPN